MPRINLARLLFALAVVVVISVSPAARAQSGAANVVVPNLINYSGVLTDMNGKPLSGIQGVTFLLYGSQDGGAPLWLETQNVTPGRNGQYTVTLGSTTSQGLPFDLFTNGEARWLGVQVSGEPELPRVLLVAVPCALKAADAQTIGGLPPSAFVLAAPPNSPGVQASASASTPAASTNAPALPPTSSDVTTTGGTVGTIAAFSTSTNIQSSLLSQTGSTAINVGGKLNLPATGTATATAGFNSRPQNFVASAFNSSTAAAVAQTFQWQAQPVGNDTSTPSGSLNLLYASGTSTPVQTGLSIANTGLITFATGQTFPGTGTITDVTAGNGLSGGGTSGAVTLSNTGLLSVTAGTGITVGSGQNPSVGINTLVVPQLAATNTFTGNQTVNGNVTATGVISASSFEIGSNLFDFGSYANSNAFLGFAGNTTVTGKSNTAAGYQALFSNGVGGSNSAFGYHALYLNNNGLSNTAVGRGTLYQNSSGSFNTAIGYFAGETVDNSAMTTNSNTFVGASALASTGTLTNVTAIGANALVTQSNTIVIGSIPSVNGATTSPLVGIGTNTPSAQLHVIAQSYADGIDVTGGAAPLASYEIGAPGIGATGGAADPAYEAASAGGDGVDGYGGNGNFSNSLDSGGSGVAGFGGGGSPDGFDGVGGYFTGATSAGDFGDGLIAFPGSGYAGVFEGDVSINGTIYPANASLKIDHPLDPANKYLLHSSVESSEMMNIYSGNVITDAQGQAAVQLPEWFEALNTDFRYQLTVIGQFAQAIVAREIENHEFTIRTSAPNVKVSWQVTAVRQDAFARAHPLVVEEEKQARLKGYYIHPDLYGAAPEKQIEWARHPQIMKKIKEVRERQARLAAASKTR